MRKANAVALPHSKGQHFTKDALGLDKAHVTRA